MSCYIVDETTLARVAVAMVSFHPKYRQTLPFELAAKLFDMNKRAFNARYGGRYRQDIPPWLSCWAGLHSAFGALPKRYPHEPNRKVNAMWFTADEQRQLLLAMRSIRCFTYQCAEGRVPDSRLYKDAEETRALIAEAYLDYTGTFEGLEWA